MQGESTTISDQLVLFNQEVFELISETIPKTLWHYTSVSGALGILESGTIWATDYRFLNDSREITHCVELLKSIAENEFPEEGDQRKIAKVLVEHVTAGGVLSQTYLRYMIASFTQAEDQLAQWRGYANDARGISIGFDLSKIRSRMSHSPNLFAKCIYEESDKRTLLSKILAGLVNDFLSSFASINPRWEPDNPGWEQEFSKRISVILSKLNFRLLCVAPLIKNRAFHEEAEWRLVVPLFAGVKNLESVGYRPSETAIVPYLPFPLLPNAQGDCACTRAIVGPGAHVSASDSLNLFLHALGVDAAVSNSKIPYRTR